MVAPLAQHLRRLTPSRCQASSFFARLLAHRRAESFTGGRIRELHRLREQPTRAGNVHEASWSSKSAVSTIDTLGESSYDLRTCSSALVSAFDPSKDLMARSDLLISLVRAATAGDRDTARSAAEALAADERAKNHTVLADRLQRALSAVPVAPPALTSAVAAAQNSGREAILEIQARTRMDDLLLPLPARENGRQLIEEHVRADVLRAHGYEPRHRLLLSGPPGNGKTSYAEALAEGLAVPFFVVRYDSLIGSYLGETNARLRRLFDYVRTRPCVLFFDEFDAIGKERGDTHETGEIKRVVSFLLMQLDQLPSYVLVVAASNHAELLDRAVWRRFQLRLNFPAPDKGQVEQYLSRIISGWPAAPALSVSKLAAQIGPSSYAEVLDFCQSVRRRHILGLGEVPIDEALQTELDLWASRVRPEVVNAERSEQTATETRAAQRRRPAAQKAKKLPRT